MKILFDKQIEDPEWVHSLNEDDVITFGTILKFLGQRFNVYEDEMGMEWMINHAFVIIMTPNDKEPDFRIGYSKYSKELTNKLKACISDEDVTYLSGLILRMKN